MRRHLRAAPRQVRLLISFIPHYAWESYGSCNVHTMERSYISALILHDKARNPQFDKSSFRSTNIFLKVGSIKIDNVASSYEAYKAK